MRGRLVSVHRTLTSPLSDCFVLSRWGANQVRQFNAPSKWLKSPRALLVRPFTVAAQLRDLESSSVHIQTPLTALPPNALPSHCHGCGAPGQTVNPDDAGFYALQRHRTADYLRQCQSSADEANQASQHSPPAAPICERCHKLLHHHEGVPIFHPSMQSIQDIVEESPYTHNHIYHVVDAADFPMSLIPNLQHALRLPKLRSQNRRSKTVNFVRGRTAEVSFVVTRADLLAPKKEQVDALMPYLRQVLRDTLSTSNRSVRLGNIRCVSAKRGWWTKEVKEEIWSRGGAGWMVGKVNVGKSNLYHVVFPKGRFSHTPHDKSRLVIDMSSETATSNADHLYTSDTLQSDVEEAHNDDIGHGLLPPARQETAFPEMPVVSSLPGTTASPIRIPFGNGKGELIDLPGVARSSLESYVKPEHRDSLVMRHRVKPEQHVIMPGQSLLIGGGLIRITPTTPDLVFLAYPFVPLDIHVTSTTKATQMQTGERDANIPSIVADDGLSSMETSGPFGLKWDVTKQRAGPLTDPRAAKLHTDRLPFVVWSADVVIEGVGWIELVAQVRKRWSETHETESDFPSVQVTSPKKQFVSLRPPMNAWLLGGRKLVPRRRKLTPRSRRSMRSVRVKSEG